VLDLLEPVALGESGDRPDYGSGPYMALVGAVVRLARLDLDNPIFAAEARAFLEGEPLGLEPGDVFLDVTLFADCIGFGGKWINGR
jgi:hypothetical protein